MRKQYDFFLFIHWDAKLKKECILAQIEKVKERLGTTRDKVFSFIHLWNLYMEIGMTIEAQKSINEALKLKSSDTDVNYDLARFLSNQGRDKEAIEYYMDVLRINPFHINASNNLAWIFATYQNADIRNGEKAVKLAEQACTLSVKPDPFLLDTLAAAYAEEANFNKAIDTVKHGIDIAVQAGFSHLAEDMKNRLRLYESNRPYRE